MVAVFQQIIFRLYSFSIFKGISENAESLRCAEIIQYSNFSKKILGIPETQYLHLAILHNRNS